MIQQNEKKSLKKYSNVILIDFDRVLASLNYEKILLESTQGNFFEFRKNIEDIIGDLYVFVQLNGQALFEQSLMLFQKVLF